MQTIMSLSGGNLHDQFKRRAARRSMATAGPYRRVPGYGDDGEDESFRGFDGVFCLVQRGLGEGPLPLMSRLLDLLRRAQADRPGAWPLVLQGFGPDTVQPAAPAVLAREERGRDTHKRRAAELLAVSGPVAPPVAAPLLITELVPDDIARRLPNFRRSWKQSLVVVIGRRGEFGFAPPLGAEIADLRRRLVVAEITDDQLLLTFDQGLDFVTAASTGGGCAIAPQP